MKRILALLLLSPSLSFGQLLEVSLKGGIVTNNVRPPEFTGLDNGENPLGFASSISVTAGLPLNIRAGLGISAYKISYTISGVSSRQSTYYAKFDYGTPIIPLEAIVIKRLKFSKLTFDLGVTGGISLNQKRIEDRQGSTGNAYRSSESWLTYGFVAGAQFNITKKLAVGAEAQPKWITIKNYAINPDLFPPFNSTRNTFLWPVMVKASVKI